jgi:hypothetical protein
MTTTSLNDPGNITPHFYLLVSKVLDFVHDNRLLKSIGRWLTAEWNIKIHYKFVFTSCPHEFSNIFPSCLLKKQPLENQMKWDLLGCKSSSSLTPLTYSSLSVRNFAIDTALSCRRLRPNQIDSMQSFFTKNPIYISHFIYFIKNNSLRSFEWDWYFAYEFVFHPDRFNNTAEDGPNFN